MRSGILCVSRLAAVGVAVAVHVAAVVAIIVAAGAGRQARQLRQGNACVELVYR